MPAPRTRAPLGFGLLLAPLLLLAGASQTTAFRHLEYLEFDWLSSLAPATLDDERIVIVGIDEPSFAELDAQWPWPRGIHGDLVRALHGAGAAVIVFDVLFAEPSEAVEDERFAAAIAAAGNVVLAADLVLQETPNYTQVIRVEPYRPLREAGALSGIASITLDTDQVVRRIPRDPDAMWRTVARVYAAASGRPVPGPTGEMIRYLDPARGFPYASYYQALGPAEFLPPGLFEDRIVYVGLDLKVSPEVALAQGEMFATPHTAFSGWPMPGVAIQATLAANALAHLGIAAAPRPWVLLVLALAAALAYGSMRRWTPLKSALRGAAGAAGLGLLSAASFVFADLWVPVSAAIAAIVIVYGMQGGLAFLHERARKQQIRQAFGYYVSPDVVREVIAHPDRLVLGGVRRELTIMFTDLAGFTALSEKMAPESVADLLNAYFTSMTDIVIGNGGTVDKFIGDAVMAFWGAPLDDPDHARHACRAAALMLERMAALRDEMTAAGLPAVAMRMGIHSGQAVVGNMGSASRFDYTAIGDNVNLASRLEGANKHYGTAVLLSAATVNLLGDDAGVAPVDRVRVAGKHEPIDVFTFCADERLARLYRDGVGAFRARDWQRAKALWEEAAAYAPGDGVATVYLERIAGFTASAPPPDWDGVASLDKQ